MLQAVALIAAAAIGIAPVSPEVQPTACWKTLFMDWADGRVGGTYSLACYRTAIARVAGDRVRYGSAGTDLRLLLNRSIAHLPPSRRATLAGSTPIVPWRQRPDTAGVGATREWKAAARIALAAVLTALLVVWVVARLRRDA